MGDFREGVLVDVLVLNRPRQRGLGLTELTGLSKLGAGGIACVAEGVSVVRGPEQTQKQVG